jgi:NAD(P)H-dependent FMN reductase
MFTLKIIIGSTRPGRKGPSIAEWIFALVKEHKEFEVELVDLAIVNLPIFNEPNHPVEQKYEHEHTKKWSNLINHTDAFILVTPEYNHSFPASIKNALDYLYKEWNYKPMAFVSYGGVAAGTRSLQLLKPIITALKMMPVTASVNIPFFSKYIDSNGKFNADESLLKSATVMLKELLIWTDGLKNMRQKLT